MNEYACFVESGRARLKNDNVASNYSYMKMRIKKAYGARRLRKGKTLLLAVVWLLVVLPVAPASAEAFTHSVRLVGISEAEMPAVHNSFQQASLLLADKAETIVSLAKLRGLVKADMQNLNKILRAEGYYAAHVSRQISRNDNHFDIKIITDPGPLYVFGDIQFTFAEPFPEEIIQIELRKRAAIHVGEAALAHTVVSAEAWITSSLPELGFPFSSPVQRTLVVDHQRQKMDVSFALEPGARQTMGMVVFSGHKSVGEPYLKRFLEWKEGDFFRQQNIDELRSRLIQTQLFSSVTIETRAANDNKADIHVELVEAEHRTLGITGGYSSAEGFGAEVSWEHRNMFSRGARLTLTARGAEIEQSLSAQLELPNFKRLDQTLSFESLLKREDTDAFFTHTAELRAHLERVLSPTVSIVAGTELEYSDVTDSTGDRDFLVAALPLGFRWDNSDDLLDPSKGMRLSVITAPSMSFGNGNFSFLKSEIRGSAYYPLINNRDLTFALRTRLGSIVGPGTARLSATRRFFSGGGGSIRGYSFQRVGPLDAGNDPIGGRSVTEIAAELRWKFTSDISLVPFFEGGNVYESELPKFNDFRWGAGLGVRYHTNFGPIRLDVAFPIERRDDESRFQLYISLGQAF